ncbi:MAG: DUF6737 family protein [Cyanobacteria bacterium P01_F01_bin.116]
MDPSEQPKSLWQLKPWWCQPWSIVLTGLTVPAVSWVWLHRWWITTPVAMVILVWWYLFLYLVPKEYEVTQSKS